MSGNWFMDKSISVFVKTGLYARSVRPLVPACRMHEETTQLKNWARQDEGPYGASREFLLTP